MKDFKIRLSYLFPYKIERQFSTGNSPDDLSRQGDYRENDGESLTWELLPVERGFAIHTGSRRFESLRRHMPERFFRSDRPGYPHPVCSELEIMVSERRSVIAVSLNNVKPAKLCKCAQTHYRHNGDGRTAPGVRSHGSIQLSHSRNVVTRTELNYNNKKS